MDKDSKFTRDEDGYIAVRTVVGTEALPASDKDWMFARDTNGNIAVRVVGGAGSAELDNIIIKSDTIPAASAEELGKFYCYSGVTTSAYTHGYIYECVAGSSYYEANIAFERSTFASEDFYKAGKLIVDAGVADPTEVTGGTMTYALAGSLWSIVFTDANGNALNTAYSIYTDDLEQDYDILPVVDPREFVDGQVVNMAINNVVEHVDYSWERLDVQPAAKLGRYLSGWNCATGLAVTNPQESPYEYTTGDYFIVSAVATGGASNYRPNGSSYVIGQASTTVETSVVTVNDMYFYDGSSWTLLKTGSTVTSVNGQVGDVTVQETLVSGTNIKTIDGNSVLGSGDLELSTYLPYPAGWATNSTTKAFCDDIAADTSAVVGKAYLGEVTLSDLPASMINGEIVVEIMSGTTAANKVIVLTLTSGNTAPYLWKYTYWNNGTDVSGWKGIGGDSLPSQTGNAGKFLTTDGTAASWGDALANLSTSSGHKELAVGYNVVATNQSNATGIRIGSDITGNHWTTNPAVAIGTGLALKNYSEGVYISSGSITDAKGGIIISGNSGGIVGNSTPHAGGIIICGGGFAQIGPNKGAYSLLLGYEGQVNASGTTLISNWRGSDRPIITEDNTFWWENENGVYKLIDSNGTIPKERLTNAATTPATMPELTVADWSSNTQTVTVTGVTASNIVIVSPAPASAADYAAAGIVCTAQAADSLTFTCDTVPTNAITVNVVILG